MTIGLNPHHRLALTELSALSTSSLDRASTHAAELTVAAVTGEGWVLGGMSRAGDAPPDLETRVVRASGGPAISAGEGTIYVGLSLPRADALTPGGDAQVINRYVRPVLRALGRVGAPAHYFGRDWIAVARRPAAWVGFAHDAGTRRVLVEAFVGVTHAFDGGVARPSYGGKAPASVGELAGKPLAVGDVREAIVEAFANAYGHALVPTEIAPGPAPRVEDEPAWEARVPEVMGSVSAGRDAGGRMRVGGDWMVSRDARASLEAALAAGPELDDAGVAAAVDAALAAPGVVTFGVRRLASVAEAIAAAYKNPR